MGLPLVTSVSVFVFQHPIGMLLGFNILSIGSAVVLALAIRSRLKFKVVALIVLAFMLFSPKDVSFEYLHMSEHVSRCLYALFAAMILYFDRWRTSLWYVALLALVVVLNFLSKPSAIILLPIVFFLYVFFWLMEHEHRWRLVRSTAIFLMLTVGAIIGYASAYKVKFGVFSISQFEGYNLLSHVGHLIDLESAVHRELKENLRPVIETYRKKYASAGNYRPNWIVFGSFDDELRADFGDKSPASIISAYIKRNKMRETQNEIYSALAWEGIRAHPIEYLRFVAASFYRLFREGYRFVYYEYSPLALHVDRHKTDVQALRQSLYRSIGQKVPTNCPAPAISDEAPWFFRISMQGELHPCSSAMYKDARQRAIAEKITNLYVGNISPFAPLFFLLPLVGAVAFIILVVLAPWWRNAAATGYALVISLTVLLYGACLGLLNTSEPARFMANIQDLAVLALALFVAIAISQAARAIRAIGSSISRRS
ncbi:MAG: hypothetical protein K2Y71_13470 [Xanthobacteraceae bacterium]|nr:hypothetical protein [Xanthobacteraceae bacterium]